MPTIKTKTTYLEMFSPPDTEFTVPRPNLELTKVKLPTIDLYRHLYRSVGSKYYWVDRLALADQELQTIIQDDLVDVFVLTISGKTAGFSELDRRVPGEIEIAYLGLFPEMIGQGLGKYLLGWTLRKAWSHALRRVWVHTCDLDHPAALPNYVKAGFQIYDVKIIDQVIP